MRIWTLAALAAVLLAVPALAQSGAPEPGCAGVYNDRAGDAEPSNLDITGFWFKHEGSKTVAVMRIADLDTSLPPDATGANWYVLWNLGDVQYFVTMSVEITAPEPSFNYGTVEETPNGTLRQQVGEVPGSLIEGPDGTILWEIPGEAGGGVSGTVFRAPLADTATSTGVGLSLLTTIDEASGRQYTVNGCESGAAPAVPGEPSPSPAPPAGEPESRELDMSVSRKVPRARKVKRSLKLRVSSKDGVSDVTARLRRGKSGTGRTVGTGRLSELEGKGRLKLRIRGKRFRKGTYTLALAGRNADGSSGERSFRLRFR